MAAREDTKSRCVFMGGPWSGNGVKYLSVPLPETVIVKVGEDPEHGGWWVYRLRPFAPPHPNHPWPAVYDGTLESECPSCSSTQHARCIQST